VSNHIEYHRTVTDRGIEVHLSDVGADLTICGFDIESGFLSYDDTVHSEQPRKLPEPTEVTCPECLTIIAIVKAYLGGSP